MPPDDSGPPAMPFCATILTAEPGKRLTKRWRAEADKPDDYDAGWLFQATEIACDSFDEFVATLASLGPDQCLIRGGIREGAREDCAAGAYVRRLEYDRDDCPAAFEAVPRNWIVLDYDDTTVPFDLANPELSIRKWRKTLPEEIRNAQSAFFLSASSHRSPTVRGKLLVALSKNTDNATAEIWARAHGADGSVCRTVQPNYLSSPEFIGCDDPLREYRQPFHFLGSVASLSISATDAELSSGAMGLGDRTSVPSDLPPLSDRGARLLSEAFVNRWLEGDRIASNAALHLFGWLLGKGWSKGEIGSVLDVLDSWEDNPKKIREHWHILGNARAIEGPGAAQEWLGPCYAEADAAVNWSPQWEAIERRAAEATRPKPIDEYQDPWTAFTDFTTARKPIEYYCEGLRLAPSKGKVSIIAGQPGGAKGPIADHLAVCFAFGEDAFDAFPCAEKRVLLLDLEGTDLTRERLERMASATGHEPDELAERIFHLDVSAINLIEVESLMHIETIVREHDISVAILDSYTSAMLASGIDSASPQFAQLAQLLGRLGILVITVAHANKAAAQRGEPRLSDIAYSGAFAALAQTALVVHYPDEEDRDLVRVACARSPHKGFAPFDIRFTDTSSGALKVALATGEVKAQRTQDIRKLRDSLANVSKYADQVEDLIRRIDVEGHGVNPRKIRDALALTSAQWNDARAELVRRGAVEEVSLPTDRFCWYKLARP